MSAELLLQEMRQALRAALPPQAFLKRDRGEALFVTNVPVDHIPGFTLERRGSLTAILPDAVWLTPLETAEAPTDLARSLVRFRGTTPDREALALFAQGMKLLDGGMTLTGLTAFDHSLRSRAALTLRGACSGGGLYALSILSHRLYQIIKEKTS